VYFVTSIDLEFWETVNITVEFNTGLGIAKGLRWEY
jgi:hypothetical protein